jgi:outer membrane lipoprotein-sorting protein
VNAFCAAALVLATSASFAAGLTAAQVVEKNAAARGGLAAWRGVKALTMSGDMDVGGKTNATVPYTLSLKRPHMSRLELKFGDQTSVQTFDGKQGWKYRPYLGRTEPEPLTAAELASEQASDDLDGALIDAERKGAKVELAGMEKVDGKDTYKLKVTRNGAARHLWIDASTFLDVKIDGEPRKLDGRPHKVAVYFRDFKPEQGLVIPHTLETVVEGVKDSRKIVVKTVRVNPTLDDALFGKPQVTAAPKPAAAPATP